MPNNSTSSDNTKTPSLTEAEELKTEGNELFRASQWTEALVAYRNALAHLPQRKSEPRPSQSLGSDASSSSTTLPSDEKVPVADEAQVENGTSSKSENEEPKAVGSNEREEVDEYAKLRAVLYGNIGACHVQLGEHKEAVEACTQALLDDPHYVKALQRRAASNVKLNTWSSLTAAEAGPYLINFLSIWLHAYNPLDYNSLLKLLPTSSPQKQGIERTLRDLKPQVEAAQKREMAEMMDKLKGFGNSILGKFGLSTDNFKFEPNGQGGYSVNFQQ
ncbi:hypothetical protein AX16_005616 [Volvariella volvacea WC 439]|nr:hypothetical protein AX16_005616 [Volvariella volvacea WC 439]